MKYLVLKTNNVGDVVVVKKTNDFQMAMKALREDFEYWFFEKVDKEYYETFENAYDYFESLGECELKEETAWLRDCNDYDFSWNIIDTTTKNILEKPMSMLDMILATTNDDSYVEGNLEIFIHDIIGIDFEEFLDMLSNKLVGNPCLMDVSYKMIDSYGENVIFNVRGDVSEILEAEPELKIRLRETLLKKNIVTILFFIDELIEKKKNETTKKLSFIQDEIRKNKKISINILDMLFDEMEDMDFFYAIRKFLNNKK